MEQARLFLAIALSFVVFLIWNIYFSDKDAQQRPPTAPPTPEVKQEQLVAEEPYAKKGPLQPTPEKEGALSLTAPRIITVISPYYQIRISEKGAVFNSVKLKKYKEAVNPEAPLKEILASEFKTNALKLGFEKNSLPEIEAAIFQANVEQELVEIHESPREIIYSWSSADGVVIEKKYIFAPDTYMVGLVVTIKNGSDQTVGDNLTLSLQKHFPEEKTMYGFKGPSAFINDKLAQVKIKKIKEQGESRGILQWIAVQDRYFMSSILVKEPVQGGMRLYAKENDIVENQFVYPVKQIQPGTQQSFRFELFFGPRSLRLLKGYGYNLDKAIDFGMFDILAKPCLWLMNFLHDNVVANYGFAIIILTILIKAVLWPLGNKSYKSMSAMKKLQPLMTEIREKHKDDKKKMNQEVMNLYRTYKINPMGGCLPMILQIPVFFALYRMLYEAIELRHAPFFFWINDLAAPDRLFRFGFSIPFMQPPYGIPVLTIIMGATMVLQQKMSPPPGDPTQAKMMMLMPVVFTVIFINFSAGLVLYWLVNNVISISQQYYISKKTA